MIFEFPFSKEGNGNTGYSQGPSYSSYEGNTVGVWGECNGGVRLNAFYRFLFREKDMRREFVNGLWYYSYYTNPDDGTLQDSVYIRNDYSVHCNKWSKLWTDESLALGRDKSGNTGINFPYMRFADVLLMYAEADNEINGRPTEKAIDCLARVHKRAFLDGDPTFVSEASASKEAFQKAVLDERKWEFAGENMRWRDLVSADSGLDGTVVLDESRSGFALDGFTDGKEEFADHVPVDTAQTLVLVERAGTAGELGMVENVLKDGSPFPAFGTLSPKRFAKGKGHAVGRMFLIIRSNIFLHEFHIVERGVEVEATLAVAADNVCCKERLLFLGGESISCVLSRIPSIETDIPLIESVSPWLALSISAIDVVCD